MTSPRNRVNATKRMLAEKIQRHRKELWDWHLEYAKKYSPPFYCSVDLRDSGHKIVPVDSNLYPAGFNNICPDDQRAAAPIFRAHVDGLFSHLSAQGRIKGGNGSTKKLVIVPESHTANKYYIENLYYLTQILSDAGYEVRLGWYGPVPEGSPDGIRLLSQTEKELTAYPIELENGVLSAGGMAADLVILNNDFSSGYPKLLDQVKQPIVPSHVLGWHSRKKSEHFLHYNRLAAEFASILDIDPWIIQIDTEEVGPVNFNEDQGTEQVAQAVERVLDRTRQAYGIHQVKHEPFAFVKNNSGTYGMGIMVVRSAEELRQMNRRAKNKMSVGKNRLPIESVVVQEGVPTATLVDRLAAEPVIYLVGCELIGGFLRTNTEKGAEENLNSQGMVFKKLCMSDLKRPGGEDEEDEEPKAKQSSEPILELVYGSIARISALATGMELSQHQAEGMPASGPCFSTTQAPAS